MLKINKFPEPPFFRKIIDENQPTNWGDLCKEPFSEDLNKLRTFIRENEQRPNEFSLCVYCERKITEKDSHIEHIKPKSKFANDTFSYDNLVISCNDQKSCGKYKGNKWDDRFINPVTENPELFLGYTNSGEIIPGKADNERAEITIDILNLNYNKLKNIRRTIILQAAAYSKELIDSFDKYYTEFPSLIKYLQTHSNN